MAETEKNINKKKLRYYIEKLIEDKKFREEVGENCYYLAFDIATGSNVEADYIYHTLTASKSGSLKKDFEEMFNHYILEQGAILDFIENCSRLIIELEGKNGDICVNYNKENEECE